MILTNLKDETHEGMRRISMDLVWEHTDRPTQTLYFEAGGSTADLLHANANAFVIACLPLATWFNEKRMLVEAPVCARLKSGFSVINQVFDEWYPKCGPVELQVPSGFVLTQPPAQRKVGTLLSGGVDGLATVRINRLTYPLDHPEAIRGFITLFGINNFDLDEHGNKVPERVQAFEAVTERLQELADAEQMDMYPVHTNVRHLAPNYRYWVGLGFGAGHSAVAQLFQGHFDKVLLASDGNGPNSAPVALHPLFNHHFSTDAVRIQGEQDEMTRVEKIALLTDWDFGRRLMQPCHYVHIPENGAINCGKCEKCVRTMLTLIGQGRLAEVEAFEEDDLKPMRVMMIPVGNVEKAKLLRQSIPVLKQRKRFDLVWAIRARLALYFVTRY